MAYKAWIDDGHGGSDPGAVGNGLRECDINLLVGKRVRYHLIRHGVLVNSSRDSDKTVGLSDRPRMANNWGADVFVSIHCNSASFTAYGIETFCYDFKYRKLADCVHGKIMENKSLYYANRGVKSADFCVLRESNMDACLVEMAFISNERDAQLLRNKQEEYAIAITKGILSYFGLAWKDDGASVPSQPTPPVVEQPKPSNPISSSKREITTTYGVHNGYRWLPVIWNDSRINDYAGQSGTTVEAFKCTVSEGKVIYQLHTPKHGWLPEVYGSDNKYSDYAGVIGTEADGLRMRLEGLDNYDIYYRVKLYGSNSYLPWVKNHEDFAGIFNKRIERIQVKVVQR